MDIKLILEKLNNQRDRITIAITFVESLEEVLAKAGFSDTNDTKPKKKHWTQLPSAKAKLAKAHRKAKRTRENQ